MGKCGFLICESNARKKKVSSTATKGKYVQRTVVAVCVLISIGNSPT